MNDDEPSICRMTTDGRPTARLKQVYRIIGGIGVAFGLVIVVCSFLAPGPKEPRPDRAGLWLGLFFIGDGSFLLLAAGCAFRMFPPCAWEATREGVSQRLTGKPEAFLGWHEIERIRLVHGDCIGELKGQASRIELANAVKVVLSEEWAAFQRYLHDRLAKDFDLTRRPPPDAFDGVEPPRLAFVLRAARVAGLGVVLTVAVIAIRLIVEAYFGVNTVEGKDATGLLTLGGIAVFYACSVVIMYRDQLRNPTWRKRIVKARIEGWE